MCSLPLPDASAVTTPPPLDAESLSCAIAGRYAGRWARSVAAFAVDDDDAEPPVPWFVDAFAGADLQRAALRGAAMQPAAVAAVRALDAAGAAARIVLVEEDPGLIARLSDELERVGAADRLRWASDPASAEPGQIVLVEAAFASIAARLAARMADEPALVRLAPLTARVMPWAGLQPFVTLPAADLLIRFPREDFAKQARFASPLADLPPHVRRVVDGCSAMLDDARHGWLLAWREAERSAGPDEAVARMVERMLALLAAAGDSRSTHALSVGQREAVHLLLSTRRAEHVAELDRAMVADEPSPAPPPRAEAPPPVLPAASIRTEESPAEEAPAEEAPAEEAPADEAPAMLDLFALPAPAAESPRAPRPSAPRARKPRPSTAEELGLFDDPETGSQD